MGTDTVLSCSLVLTWILLLACGKHVDPRVWRAKLRLPDEMEMPVSLAPLVRYRVDLQQPQGLAKVLILDARLER